MALLWPERDVRHARKLLNQSVYVLRKAIGKAAILSVGEEVQLDDARVHCDVVAFDEALGAGERERAAALYTGPFLDGFHLGGSPEFERWVDGERARLAGAHARTLEDLAEAATARGDLGDAVAWWTERSAHDPYDSRVALRLMEALVQAGNPAGAVQRADEHRRLLREDLGIDPPEDVTALAERVRREFERAGSGEEPPPPAIKTVMGGADRRREPTGRDSRPRRLRTVVWYGAAAVVLLSIATAGARLTWHRFAPAEGFPPGGTPEHGTSNMRALELFQRGSRPDLLRSSTGAREALDALLPAVELDPGFAPAFAALACVALRVSGDAQGDTSRTELRALAREAADSAVSLDPSLAEARAALGLVRMAEFDFDAAEEHLQRAIELDPTLPRPREWLVTVYLWTGRRAAALDVASGARDLDPLSGTANAEMARALAASGRCDEAMVGIAELQELDLRLLRVGPISATCHAHEGRWKDAAEALRPDAGVDPYSKALLAHALARAGEMDEARLIRSELFEPRNGTGALPVAVVEAGLGRLDQAFASLNRAIDDGSLIGSPLHYQVMSMLAGSLGGDPRFDRLRARIRLDSP